MRRRRCFYILAVIIFLMILLFNLLTPMLTDDYSYATQVRRATSVWDLLRQEQYQYMTWNGRSVVHFLLRCFLSLPTPIFKVANSLMFVLLSWLIYDNIPGRKAYDCFVWMFVQAGLWFYAVDFSQTILWETGACNYLWGTCIILLFMTLLRHHYEKKTGIYPIWNVLLPTSKEAADREKHEMRKSAATGKDSTSFHSALSEKKGVSWIPAAGFFLLGVAAGWCNENTSGGAFLFVLFLLITVKIKKGILLPAGLAAAAGNLLGLLIMVTAPGNTIRASFAEENHTGLVGMIARAQKLTLNIQTNFQVLLCVLIVTIVISVLQKKGQGKGYRVILREMAGQILFAFLFLATSYALVMTAETQARAFFGAGIFLLIACIQGIVDICRTECEIGSANTNADIHGIWVRGASWSILLILMLQLVFTFLKDGTNLGRIYRECAERQALVEEAAAQGKQEVTVAQLRPEFETRFSDAYNSDLQEDPGYWTNVAYEGYFGVESISAVPREEWEALQNEESLQKEGNLQSEDTADTEEVQSDEQKKGEQE